MCSRASHSTQNISLIMCFRVHAQHKHFINHVLQGPHPTQTYIYIYISSTIGLRSNIQNNSSCLYAVGPLTQYKIKHEYNYHDQYAYAINGRSKIRDITLSPSYLESCESVLNSSSVHNYDWFCLL